MEPSNEDLVSAPFFHEILTHGRNIMGRQYRNPRTQQERRANGSHEHRHVEIEVGGECHEVRIQIRGKRSVRMLVEAWHDLPRGIQRSWKKHRAHSIIIR